MFYTDEIVQSEIKKATVEGKDVTLISINELDTDKWSKNLKHVPSTESCDIMIYFMKECGWEDERLKKYKSDNGYKLHLANHVGNVEMAKIPDVPYTYIKCTCVPETRQNDTPYQTWVCIKDDGTVHSGGCACVA